MADESIVTQFQGLPTGICPLCGSAQISNTSQCSSCGEDLASPGGDLPAGQNHVGRAGFFVSLAGICGVAAAGPFGNFVTGIGIALAFLSLPGIVLCVVGLRRTPRRLAAWGLVIGIAGALYLPTFCLVLFRRL
jgi:hypothetical protein